MRWARAVVALGSVLLVLGFGLAVTPVSVVLDGQEQPCDLALDPWRAWGSSGLGALVLLVGSTAVREVGSTGRPDVRRTGVPV